MASTFSTTLRLELIGDGDQSGIWGQTTNTNLGTLLEQSITGVVSITMTDANYTLTNFNGVSDEARNAVLVVGGTNAAVRDIIAPLVEKLYVIRNSTVGGFGIRIIGSSGTGVTVPSGATVWVYCDGTNFNAVGTESVGNFEVNGNLTVTGNTNAVAATYTGNVAALNLSTANLAATGNVTATGNVSATGNVTATNFIGAGTTITSINASNISSGTIANARTTASSSNGASTIVTRDSGGNFAANTVTANLTGNATGSAATVTNATQSSITSIPNLATVGTITSGTWSGSFGAVSGVNLTNLNASNLGSGTVPAARMSGTYPIDISGAAASATTVGLSQFAASLSSTGYQKLPTGLIIQWGLANGVPVAPNVTTPGVAVVSYSIPFTSGVYYIGCSPQDTVGSNIQMSTPLVYTDGSFTQFQFQNTDLDTAIGNFRWIAVGV